MDLAPDELIARVRLPRREPGWREHYRKVGTRRAQAISKVCLAGALKMDEPAARLPTCELPSAVWRRP